ncbi:hypothetical protein [Catalinimonas niigatensis]|nr:hypothetical protein [Catalinimonas niigatensis]WPP49484.1 hypothetical protein PZB72_22700 [Catalinimonas niigatensis]
MSNHCVVTTQQPQKKYSHGPDPGHHLINTCAEGGQACGNAAKTVGEEQ